MKHLVRLFLAMVLAGLVQAAWPQDVLISTGEFAPWTGEKLPGGGYVNRIVREAFRREGLTVRFHYTSWPRAMAKLQHNEVMASSYWMPDPVRDKQFLRSASLVEDRWLLFLRFGTHLPKWQKLADLSAFRFGLTRSYTYNRELRDLVDKGTLKAGIAPDDRTNLHNLLAGRVDIVPLSEITGWVQIAKVTASGDGHGILRADEKPLMVSSGYLLINKNGHGAQLLKQFNAGLASMRQDGTLARYHQDFILGRASSP